jgi:membrane associated rhomboid family serine protease
MRVRAHTEAGCALGSVVRQGRAADTIARTMATEVWSCYRHPDRRAGVACQRCDRPICPECMSQAPVGFHCPECLRRGRQRVITARSLQTRPLLTQALIAINVAVFVVGTLFAGSVFGLGESAGEGVLNAGDVAEGDWWRLITSGFLHYGLYHIILNMLALWVLGSQLEPALGRARFAIVYFGSLLGGSLGALLLSPNVNTVGASGAIFGLMGAAVAAHVVRGVSIWSTGIGMVLAINLGFTFLFPRISIGGHLGGLVTGFLLGLLVLEVPSGSRRSSLAIAGGVAATVALFAAGLLVATALT